MNFVSIELKEANEFIAYFHRHSKKVLRAKFQIGLMEGNELIGVGIVGRPVARHLDDKKTLEVLRVCVKEDHKNASSKIYSRCRHIAQLLGYEKVITYTLKRESGTTMRALGAFIEAETIAQEWSRESRKRTSQPIYSEPKLRWNLSGVVTE